MYVFTLNEYLKRTYGQKLYKVSLDGGMTCPNRDGKIDTRGCIFAVKAVRENLPKNSAEVLIFSLKGQRNG